MRGALFQSILLAAALFLGAADPGADAAPGIVRVIHAPGPDTPISVKPTQPGQPVRTYTFRSYLKGLDGIKHPMPSLPPGAAGKRLSGKVQLLVTVAGSGRVQKVDVTGSSGSKLLDEAARAWVQYVWLYPQTESQKTHAEAVVFHTTAHDIQEETRGAAYWGSAAHPGLPIPAYPGLAISLGWQGDVSLALVMDGKGDVKSAVITRSSGVPLLDYIAQAYVEAYWRLPGMASTPCVISFRLG